MGNDGEGRTLPGADRAGGLTEIVPDISGAS